METNETKETRRQADQAIVDEAADDVAGHALMLGAVAATTFLVATNPIAQAYVIYKLVK